MRKQYALYNAAGEPTGYFTPRGNKGIADNSSQLQIKQEIFLHLGNGSFPCQLHITFWLTRQDDCIPHTKLKVHTCNLVEV